MGRERRKAKRHLLRYGAWLVLADGTLSECVLSDISETGARLMVDDSALVPEKFVLVLSRNGAVRRCCKVVWRNPQEVGVKFDEIGASDGHTIAPCRHQPTAKCSSGSTCPPDRDLNQRHETTTLRPGPARPACGPKHSFDAPSPMTLRRTKAIPVRGARRPMNRDHRDSRLRRGPVMTWVSFCVLKTRELSEFRFPQRSGNEAAAFSLSPVTAGTGGFRRANKHHGANHAWNDTDYSAGLGAGRRLSALAAQRRLGLRPVRHRRRPADRRARAGAERTNVKQLSAWPRADQDSGLEFLV